MFSSVATPNTLSNRQARLLPHEHEKEEIDSGDASTKPAEKIKELNFEQIVEEYHDKVFRLVFRYTANYDEACDTTQETFVRAFRAWDSFRGESEVYTWLYRIALNLCHNQKKKLNRRRTVEGRSIDQPSGADEDGAPQEYSDSRPIAAQLLESDELRDKLHLALAQLPENYRTVLVLRDIEGLRYDEIASITDSSMEAIKSRLFRARNQLKEVLTPYFLNADIEE